MKNDIAKDLEARLNEMADKFGEYVEMLVSEKKVIMDQDDEEYEEDPEGDEESEEDPEGDEVDEESDEIDEKKKK